MVVKKKGAEKHWTITFFAALLVIAIVSILVFKDSPPAFFTGYATSQVGNFSASIATYISCTWSTDALSVSFGSNLNPSTFGNNATQNFNATSATCANCTHYNVTIDTLSNVAGNITIKGENFVSGANVIGVTNITWASNITLANGTNMISGNGIILNSSFNPVNTVGTARAIGSTTYFRFWLIVPNGTIAGSYTGNYTQQCQAAT